MPSAKAAYTPTSGSSGPSYTTSTGLVYAYQYNSDNRLEETQVGEGTAATFILIERRTYGDADPEGSEWDSGNSNPAYVSKIERFQSATSTQPEDVEVTTLFYSFYAGDAIEWVEIEVESELEAENGPEASYYSHELFDSRGRNYWSRAADDSLTSREFDEYTGALTRVDAMPRQRDFRRHCPPMAAGTAATPMAALWSVPTRSISWGAVQEQVTPGGVSTFTRREMRELLERPDIEYYAVVTLLHEFEESSSTVYDGPARVTWYNADDDVIRTSDWEVTPSYTFSTASEGYTTVIDDYALGDELSRSVVDHDVSGLVSARKVWHDIGRDAYYETGYSYDALGRLQEVTDPNGTITRKVYDALNRVTEVQVGTASARTWLASPSTSTTTRTSGP